MGKKHKKKKTTSGGKRSSSKEKISDRKISNNHVHEKPMRQMCFTKDFAYMIQLFRSLTEFLDFSRPFNVVIKYDPELSRVSIETYAPMEVHERYNQKAEEIKKD